jgi:hypothetical protein
VPCSLLYSIPTWEASCLCPLVKTIKNNRCWPSRPYQSLVTCWDSFCKPKWIDEEQQGWRPKRNNAKENVLGRIGPLDHVQCTTPSSRAPTPQLGSIWVVTFWDKFCKPKRRDDEDDNKKDDDLKRNHGKEKFWEEKVTGIIFSALLLPLYHTHPTWEASCIWSLVKQMKKLLLLAATTLQVSCDFFRLFLQRRKGSTRTSTTRMMTLKGTIGKKYNQPQFVWGRKGPWEHLQYATSLCRPHTPHLGSSLYMLSVVKRKEKCTANDPSSLPKLIPHHCQNCLKKSRLTCRTATANNNRSSFVWQETHPNWEASWICSLVKQMKNDCCSPSRPYKSVVTFWDSFCKQKRIDDDDDNKDDDLQGSNGEENVWQKKSLRSFAVHYSFL